MHIRVFLSLTYLLIYSKGLLVSGTYNFSLVEDCILQVEPIKVYFCLTHLGSLHGISYKVDKTMYLGWIKAAVVHIHSQMARMINSTTLLESSCLKFKPHLKLSLVVYALGW